MWYGPNGSGRGLDGTVPLRLPRSRVSARHPRGHHRRAHDVQLHAPGWRRRDITTDRRGQDPQVPQALRRCTSRKTTRSSWATRSSRRACRAWASSPRGSALAFGLTGGNLRASGFDCDVRRDRPYAAYAEMDFEVPVADDGDAYARCRVRLDEMRQSARMIEQCIDGLPEGELHRQGRQGAAPAGG